jgi:hypothetical protein
MDVWMPSAVSFINYEWRGNFSRFLLHFSPPGKEGGRQFVIFDSQFAAIDAINPIIECFPLSRDTGEAFSRAISLDK